MILTDTISMMIDSDYKEQLRGEYYQAKIRMRTLSETIKSYDTKNSDLNCSVDILKKQLLIMEDYVSVLKERLRIEGVNFR